MCPLNICAKWNSSSSNQDIPPKSRCWLWRCADRYHPHPQANFGSKQEEDAFYAVNRWCENNCLMLHNTFPCIRVCSDCCVLSGLCWREKKMKFNFITKDCGSRLSAACPALLPEGVLSNLDFPSWDGVKQRFCVFPGEWEIHSVYQGMMGKNQDGGGSHQWENK